MSLNCLLNLPVVFAAGVIASQPVFADDVLLSESLQLAIPQLRYQNHNQPEQLFWANLQYRPSQDGLLWFSVQDYGPVTGNASPPLKPLAEISDQGPPRITTLGSDSATLSFKASTPLACAVVYGVDRNFGAVSTDPAMNGGALTEHHPVLRGLKADTEYFYRVQGSAPNGTLYWSEVASFRTPKAAAETRTNYAALSNGANISQVSSNFGGASNSQTWGADSAIDDSSASAWSSNGDGDNAYIEISLAKTTFINTIEVWSRSMSDGSAKILGFNISVDSGKVLGPFDLPGVDKAYSFDIKTEAKTLRLTVLESTGGNTGLIAFGAY